MTLGIADIKSIRDMIYDILINDFNINAPLTYKDSYNPPNTRDAIKEIIDPSSPESPEDGKT